MVDSNGSWLSKNNKLITIIAVILVIVIVLIFIGYQFDWTGFNAYSITVQTNATKGTTLPTNITVTLPSKTLYDWLQLLFIPTILTLGAVWLTTRQNHDREIAEEAHRQTALQGYIDKMSELLLEKVLRHSKQDDEVRNIARLRTVAVFDQIGPLHKRILLRFLQESGLIYKDDTIVSLEFANLEETDLYYANLRRTNLRNFLFKYGLSKQYSFAGCRFDRCSIDGC
jgi:uncharacterized protein YjbI with pentapeptide repeats